MRILFVENHARFAKLTTQQFLSQHQVTIVGSLHSARAALDQEFDLMLIDYDLDDGKGDELVSELQRRCQRPKIIAVSSHQAGNEKLFQAGADTICEKIKFTKIAETIDRLF